MRKTQKTKTNPKQNKTEKKCIAIVMCVTSLIFKAALIGAATEAPRRPLFLINHPRDIQRARDSRPHPQLPSQVVWPGRSTDRYCVQVPLPGRHIFSLSFTGWNAICTGKRMAAVLGHLVSSDTAEPMKRLELDGGAY